MKRGRAYCWLLLKEHDLQATKLQPEYRQVMQGWAGRLRHWRLNQITASLLEAGGPLKIIGAQLVFISQPMFSGLLSSDNLDLLAEILEKPERTSTFVQFLREEAQE
jgi:hypothetical protein